MDDITRILRPGEARCPGALSTQEIVHRDGVPVPDVLAMESYEFLGDEDIPYERYTSKAFFDREMEKMWTRVWQWACREEHLPNPGDYIVYDVGSHSILVVRTEENEIKAYYNACLHRGTKIRPSASEGSATELRCPYHGWTWTLDGDLKRIPCRWDFPHVTDEEFSLPEVRVGLWGGFVFINMDDNAPTLEDYLEELPEHFKNWRLEDRYVTLHMQKELPCNWKTAEEAFMENYHTQETHPQIMKANGDANTQYDTFGDHVTRFLAAMGTQSPNVEKPMTEQDLLDEMLLGDRSLIGDKILVPEGQTARRVMADYLKNSIGDAFKTDLSEATDVEMIDVIEYTLFPNMFLFPGFSLPMVYRFRPLGADPEKSLFDLLFLRPVPTGGPRPEPAQPVRLGVNDLYADVPGMDVFLGHVYDQDTGNLGWQQEGFHSSKKRAQTLGNYQEIRIRKLHKTLDKYLND